jgi:hypothetical protein
LEDSVRGLATVPSIPASFRDALKAGWKIVKEETTANADESQRSGVLLLVRKDVPTRLRIDYNATAKDWTFKTPQPIEETLAA